MYSQFRAQYPMGSLTTELLYLQQGHYVVKASVQVGETTLATGLSAATTIEQAEDNARARALLVLGIGITPYESQVQMFPDPEQTAPARLNPAKQELLEMADDLPPPEDVAMSWSTEPRSEWLTSPDVEADQQAFSGANGTPSLEQEPQPVSAKGRSSRGRKPSTQQRRRTPSSREPEPATPPPEKGPIDLSDIIAQTDVELKRLGWTNVQGREYLLRHYKKRSRQQLTDEELLDFLHQLQAQAPAEDPPF